MSETLKDCPFCGKGAVMFVRDYEQRRFYVACLDFCNSKQHETPAAAMESWNVRANRTTCG